jgi:molybdopterin-guanine dinucleotide biosynthesis protein B
MHESRDGHDPTPEQLIPHMTPVDLLLIEGFKREGHDKLEVWRTATGKPLLAREDRSILAVASDGPVPGLAIPVLDLDDTPSIADFILKHCGLAARG